MGACRNAGSVHDDASWPGQLSGVSRTSRLAGIWRKTGSRGGPAA
jgi:hypothetical protein